MQSVLWDALEFLLLLVFLYPFPYFFAPLLPKLSRILACLRQVPSGGDVRLVRRGIRWQEQGRAQTRADCLPRAHQPFHHPFQQHDHTHHDPHEQDEPVLPPVVCARAPLGVPVCEWAAPPGPLACVRTTPPIQLFPVHISGPTTPRGGSAPPAEHVVGGGNGMEAGAAFGGG